MRKIYSTAVAALLLLNSFAQNSTRVADSLKNLSYAGLKFRSIGPAFVGGRVVDIAVNPFDKTEFYVASGHGSLWKTKNNGVTFTPVFDNQASYSMGCVKIAPSNPNIVWVGTGEANNQNNVIYGDGVYRSEDAGKTWKNMGLKNSDQVGGIAIDPRDEKTVYVAAYGSLRNDGGDRGVYKTNDGGNTWKRSLYISEYTGIYEIHMNPRNSMNLFAVAHQRQRKLYTGIRGGAESGIYRTLDSGATWQKLSNGLPKEDVGRIGLAISPRNPNYIYAIVEAKEGSGIYRSTDLGASWTKQSSYLSSYPFYMNKIFCDPQNVDKVYSMDVQNQVSIDGGKTWKLLGEKNKHVDNHALYVDPADPRHMLAGCDGGLYETWDGAENWDFKSNIPLAEVYKVTTDNSYPFYMVYAGTQDNSSFGGPSRTLNASGITNSDWFITTGGDGFESQADWKDGNTVYAQSQNGGLVRFDRKSGEQLELKPIERNDSGYRFDWSSPLLISSHNNKRLYFGANKLLRTNDQGNTWEEISNDLTRGVPTRMQRLMNRVWSMDELAAKGSMAQLSAIAESPLDENLIFTGSGDGLIYMSSNGGKTWTKSNNPPALPDYSRISQITPSNFNKNVVYLAAENFGGGNYAPYLYKSVDGGKNWTSINANLPKKGSTFCIAEDHVNPNLLFVGTQFGVYFTNTGGSEWIQLKGGIPPTMVSDMEIQKRENDLVVSSFGRGIYILDDYSALRNVTTETLSKPATIFPVKDALMYIQAKPLGYRGVGFQGASFFTTPNPQPGAVFTYYIRDDYKSLAKQRREREKEKQKRGEDFDMPVIDSLRMEMLEQPPFLLFTITDEQGNVIRRLKKDVSKGLNRIQWDFRFPAPNAINLTTDENPLPWAGEEAGYMVVPGKYFVSMDKFENGTYTKLAAPVPFNTVALNYNSLAATDRQALMAFNKKVFELVRAVESANQYRSELVSRIPYYKKAVIETPRLPATTLQDILQLERDLEAFNRKLNGDALRGRYESVGPTSLRSKISSISDGLWSSTSAPTTTFNDAYGAVENSFEGLLAELKAISAKAQKIDQSLEQYGAPFTPGRLPVWNR